MSNKVQDTAITLANLRCLAADMEQHRESTDVIMAWPSGIAVRIDDEGQPVPTSPDQATAFRVTPELTILNGRSEPAVLCFRGVACARMAINLKAAITLLETK